VNSSREILIDMWTQERRVLMAEQDTDDLTLSSAARDALWSATESPEEFPAWLITCSVEVARELYRWADAGVEVARRDVRYPLPMAERLKPLSLYPLSPADTLAAMLRVPPPPTMAKPAKRWASKRARKWPS
jgi:hypothetical protein